MPDPFTQEEIDLAKLMAEVVDSALSPYSWRDWLIMARVHLQRIKSSQ